MPNNIHKRAIESGSSNYGNVKKVFLSYPCNYFLDHPEVQFEIFNKISCEFKIPFSSIRISGSAHTGYSFIKKRPFLERESDLDVAIIDARLFQQLLEQCYERSEGFRPDMFPTEEGKSLRNQFLNYSGRGILRPDLMPKGPEKQRIWSFFNRLSNEYAERFKNINAGIYLSETIYTLKQRSSIQSQEIEIV
ncbi:MAG: hypothetical protein PHX38_01145 [Sulfuricella sp.]|nr:hypothetical protein [Sulfuricella sp.]